MLQQKDIPILLAFLDEMHKNPKEAGPLQHPLVLDGDFHARLKQKLLGLENKFALLNKPLKQEKISPILQISKNPEKHASLNKALVQIAENWIQDGGAPFDMLIAHKGEIIFHESFGADAYGQFSKSTASEIASITKLVTGLLFAQFLDQGLVALDDPVGKYLPDFPLEGPRAVTLRQCFTHTNAFYGHGYLGGVQNPWLENSLVHLIKEDTVGKRHYYNGMGYNLAGKVMEIISGKSIIRLFQEQLYLPLQLENTYHEWDLAYSIHSTAYDLAKLAQLLLNQGQYGKLHFFSEDTYQQLLPQALNNFYPGLKEEWGIGITKMNWQLRDEKNNTLDSAFKGSPIYGHGSATASVFWVIPEYDLVITQSRRKANSNYAPNFSKMIRAIEKHLSLE